MVLRLRGVCSASQLSRRRFIRTALPRVSLPASRRDGRSVDPVGLLRKAHNYGY